MALFRSDSAGGARPRPAATPAEPHTTVGAGTTLDGALRALDTLNVAGTVDSEVVAIAGYVACPLTVRERFVQRPPAVFNGRCELEVAPTHTADEAASAAPLLDGAALPGIAATA